jgi:hypothetical protein
MMTERLELTGSARALVEERLDAIDRVLLEVGMSRGERCGIVQEVEAQVYELLTRRTTGEPNRQDVRDVLASLDPPEAYAPEGYRHRLYNRLRAAPRLPQPSLLAVGAAVGAGLNLVAVGLLLALGLTGEGDAILLVPLAFLGLVTPLGVSACGIVAIVRIRRSGGWLYGLPAASFATLCFPLLLVNTLLIGLLLALGELGLVAGTCMAILVSNGLAIWLVAKLISAGYQPAPVGDA